MTRLKLGDTNSARLAASSFEASANAPIKLLTKLLDDQTRPIALPSIPIRVAPHTAMSRSAQTAIYPPTRFGFPYVAVIFSRDGTVQARHPCESKEDAEAFLQALTQGDASGGPGF